MTYAPGLPSLDRVPSLQAVAKLLALCAPDASTHTALARSTQHHLQQQPGGWQPGCEVALCATAAAGLAHADADLLLAAVCVHIPKIPAVHASQVIGDSLSPTDVVCAFGLMLPKGGPSPTATQREAAWALLLTLAGTGRAQQASALEWAGVAQAAAERVGSSAEQACLIQLMEAGLQQRQGLEAGVVLQVAVSQLERGRSSISSNSAAAEEAAQLLQLVPVPSAPSAAWHVRAHGGGDCADAVLRLAERLLRAGRGFGACGDWLVQALRCIDGSSGRGEPWCSQLSSQVQQGLMAALCDQGEVPLALKVREPTRECGPAFPGAMERGRQSLVAAPARDSAQLVGPTAA